MIPFAVTIKGVTQEGEAKWVLAVGEAKLLTTDKDGRLRWYPIERCRFFRFVDPTAPQPVIPVQPQITRAPANGLHLPN